MATTPYFVLSPNTILSMIGLLHGPDKTVPTPAEDWRLAKVDVVIPAFNEEENIGLVLAALSRQTLKPKRIVLIDDGSSDLTVSYARDFAQANNMAIEIIQRQRSIGKTPTLKRQSRESSADVEFILDADTILESPNYIERTVEELYKAVGIACACGTILPTRPRDRDALMQLPAMVRFLAARPEAAPCKPCGRWRRFMKAVTSLYRDVLYMFLQKFVYRGQLVLFGTITNPVGCAVAYRRKYVKELFDHFEPILGDDLTNSEDIFIGFALNSTGYRNIQLGDVFARSEEPEVPHLPRQVYMWSSSFLQSCYYFNDLIKSPFKACKRAQRIRRQRRQGLEEKRVIGEPYRQPFGLDFTREFGRPIGWVILLSAAEKVFFPFAMVLMMLLGWWETLGITLAAETAVSLTILGFVARSPKQGVYTKSNYRGLQYFFKGLLVTPLRYLSLLFDLVTIGIFIFHIWIRGERKWRK
jgi:glycosyltransferase involved in cell wall biosynthesis